MQSYLVQWKINIDANDPIEAAKEARKIQLDSGSTSTVFQVTDEITGKEETVDLEELPWEEADVLKDDIQKWEDLTKQQEAADDNTRCPECGEQMIACCCVQERAHEILKELLKKGKVCK